MWWASSFFLWRDNLSTSSGDFFLNLCCGLCVQTQSEKVEKEAKLDKHIWPTHVEVYHRVKNPLDESSICDFDSSQHCTKIEQRQKEKINKRQRSRKRQEHSRIDKENSSVNRNQELKQTNLKNEYQVRYKPKCIDTSLSVETKQTSKMECKNVSEEKNSRAAFQVKSIYDCCGVNTSDYSPGYASHSRDVRCVSPQLIAFSHNTDIHQACGPKPNLQRPFERKEIQKKHRSPTSRRGRSGGPPRLPSFDQISDAIGPQQDPSTSDRLSRCRLQRQFSLENGTIERLEEREVEQMQCEMPSDTSEEGSRRSADPYQGSEETSPQESSGINRTPLPNQDDIKYKCLALWQLRSTLEDSDPEDMSNEIPAEKTPSPKLNVLEGFQDETDLSKMETENEEFHENAENCPERMENSSGMLSPSLRNETSDMIPLNKSPNLPNLKSPHLTAAEERRLSYRRILSLRLKRMGIPSDTSFDSVDTDTSSVTDVFNTSIESSTTDNYTDSDCSTANRLRQMKSDSGYRSIESNAKDTYQKVKSDSYRSIDSPCTSNDRTYTVPIPIPSKSATFPSRNSSQYKVNEDKSYFLTEEEVNGSKERRNPIRSKRSGSLRSSTKCKREILGEWQQLSFESDEASGKRSVMARFFQTHRTSETSTAGFHRKKLQDFSRDWRSPGILLRDYSIDEKTDRIFREFSKVDLPELEKRSKERLSGRRASNKIDLGTLAPLDPKETSPRRIRRKLSPHDSIEEECENAIDTSRRLAMLEERQNIDPKEDSFRHKLL